MCQFDYVIYVYLHIWLHIHTCLYRSSVFLFLHVPYFLFSSRGSSLWFFFVSVLVLLFSLSCSVFCRRSRSPVFSIIFQLFIRLFYFLLIMPDHQWMLRYYIFKLCLFIPKQIPSIHYFIVFIHVYIIFSLWCYIKLATICLPTWLTSLPKVLLCPYKIWLLKQSNYKKIRDECYGCEVYY